MALDALTLLSLRAHHWSGRWRVTIVSLALEVLVKRLQLVPWYGELVVACIAQARHGPPRRSASNLV